MHTAEEIADRLIEAMGIGPTYHTLLTRTLLDFAAEQARAWGEHEWEVQGNTLYFGPDDDFVTIPGGDPSLYRLVAAHEATRKALADVQSRMDQIRELTR